MEDNLFFGAASSDFSGGLSFSSVVSGRWHSIIQYALSAHDRVEFDILDYLRAFKFGRDTAGNLRPSVCGLYFSTFIVDCSSSKSMPSALASAGGGASP